MELQYLGYADLNCLMNAVIPNLQREAAVAAAGRLAGCRRFGTPRLPGIRGRGQHFLPAARRLFAQQHSFHLH